MSIVGFFRTQGVVILLSILWVSEARSDFMFDPFTALQSANTTMSVNVGPSFYVDRTLGPKTSITSQGLVFQNLLSGESDSVTWTAQGGQGVYFGTALPKPSSGGQKADPPTIAGKFTLELWGGTNSTFTPADLAGVPFATVTVDVSSDVVFNYIIPANYYFYQGKETFKNTSADTGTETKPSDNPDTQEREGGFSMASVPEPSSFAYAALLLPLFLFRRRGNRGQPHT